MTGETSTYYSLVSPNGSTQSNESPTLRFPQINRKPIPSPDYHRLEDEQHVQSRPTTPTTLSHDEAPILPRTPPTDTQTSATPFRRHRQLLRLLLMGSVHFMITVALILGLYGVFVMYERHGIMGEGGKRAYNTFVTGLSMALGINIATSFKAIAVDVRWWILSQKKRSMDEVCSPCSPSNVTKNRESRLIAFRLTRFLLLAV